MWGTVKEGPVRIILVLSLDTDKARCRWRRSLTVMVMLLTRMLSRKTMLGWVKTLEDLDFLGNHDELQLGHLVIREQGKEGASTQPYPCPP